MRLDRPFAQLPLLFDAARLQAEVGALPEEAWVPHPDGIAGNSAVRLISSEGAENDSIHGQMRITPWLEAMPYLRQVLAAFGVVWGRSRLMRLAPRTGVPDHADINYHWHTRVRVHIPVWTNPAVRFHCDGEAVHMAAGEAWIFDNWRRHHVDNAADSARIHLVADTSGTSAFWAMANAAPVPRESWRRIGWRPDGPCVPMTECNQRQPIMPPAEVQWLLDDLGRELCAGEDSGAGPQQVARFVALLDRFAQDWRQLCALHGLSGRESAAFAGLGRALHDAIAPHAQGLAMRGNGAAALLVLEKRVLQHLVVP